MYCRAAHITSVVCQIPRAPENSLLSVEQRGLTPVDTCRTSRCSYKRVKGISHIVEERISIDTCRTSRCRWCAWKEADSFRFSREVLPAYVQRKTVLKPSSVAGVHALLATAPSTLTTGRTTEPLPRAAYCLQYNGIHSATVCTVKVWFLSSQIPVFSVHAHLSGILVDTVHWGNQHRCFFTNRHAKGTRTSSRDHQKTRFTVTASLQGVSLLVRPTGRTSTEAAGVRFELRPRAIMMS